MPGPWNDATDKQLLLVIIHLTAPGLPKWDQVAEKMGDGFTAESVRQHYQKLRKIAAQEVGEVSPGTNKKGGAKMSAEGGTHKTPRSRGAPKRKKAKVELETWANESDEDEENVKKMIKTDPEGGSDDDVV